MEYWSLAHHGFDVERYFINNGSVVTSGHVFGPSDVGVSSQSSGATYEVADRCCVLCLVAVLGLDLGHGWAQ